MHVRRTDISRRTNSKLGKRFHTIADIFLRSDISEVHNLSNFRFHSIFSGFLSKNEYEATTSSSWRWFKWRITTNHLHIKGSNQRRPVYTRRTGWRRWTKAQTPTCCSCHCDHTCCKCDYYWTVSYNTHSTNKQKYYSCSHSNSTSRTKRLRHTSSISSCGILILIEHNTLCQHHLRWSKQDSNQHCWSNNWLKHECHCIAYTRVGYYCNDEWRWWGSFVYVLRTYTKKNAYALALYRPTTSFLLFMHDTTYGIRFISACSQVKILAFGKMTAAFHETMSLAAKQHKVLNDPIVTSVTTQVVNSTAAFQSRLIIPTPARPCIRLTHD